MLQYIATKIGVMVLLTLKCHGELLAGEGKEFMWWACSKVAYRNLSLKEKMERTSSMQGCAIVFQSKSSQLEHESLHGVLISTTIMASYDAIIDSGWVDQQTQQGYSKYGLVALTWLIDEFKTHRCAFDFDYKFVRGVMNDGGWC